MNDAATHPIDATDTLEEISKLVERVAKDPKTLEADSTIFFAADLREVDHARLVAALEAAGADLGVFKKLVKAQRREFSEAARAAKATAKETERAAAREARSAKPRPSKPATASTVFMLTDLGNAERLIAKFGDRLRYCAPRRRWLVWDGKRWAWDETAAIERFAKRTVRAIYEEARSSDDPDARKAIAAHAVASESVARIHAMIDLAKSQEHVPVLPAELDANPWLLNCANGTIDLRSGKLQLHDRDDLITKLAPVDFDAKAMNETWNSFLRDATDDDGEFAAYLQRVAGYCLTGSQAEKCLFFAYGPPNTGKSTFLDALLAALGDYACNAAADTWLKQTATGGNRGDLVRLMGMRLVVSVEVAAGSRWDESLMKRITGGDSIVAAAKYEAEAEFKASFKIVCAANDAPKLRDDDEAMWNRMRRMPFAHVPPTRDPKVRQELTTKASAAVLAWAVQGCAKWRELGLGSCVAVEASTADYRKEMDRFAPFADERLVFEPNDETFVTAGDLRQAYELWCKDNGVRVPMSANDVGARLRRAGARKGKVHGGRDAWRRVRLSRAHDDHAETRAN